MIHLVLKKQVTRGEQEIGRTTVAAWQCQFGYLLPPEASTLLACAEDRLAGLLPKAKKNKRLLQKLI